MSWKSKELISLEAEVDLFPRDVGARLRYGMALLDSGRKTQAADQLRLAARIESTNPHIALLAVAALIHADQEREAALLLSSHVKPQRAFVRVAPQELELLEGLLNHPAAFVRCHTARALGRLKIVQCREALERTCSDSDGAVRLAAMASLKQMICH